MNENNLENRGNIITGIPREHELPGKIKQSRISKKKKKKKKSENSPTSKNYQLPKRSNVIPRNKKVSEVKFKFTRLPPIFQETNRIVRLKAFHKFNRGI